ncbi:MAG: hypothetical protein ACE364_06465 [Chlorobiota bacterium]
MLSRNHYISVSLIWLIIAVALAALLRSVFAYNLGSWFNYQYMLHTHSHLAFLGWVFNALYYLLLKQYNLLNKKKYPHLFILLNLSVVGMLFTFPFTGYALWSIVFSTLHIVLSYVFGFMLWRDTKGDNSLHRKFAMAAVFFMVLSSIGPFSLGPIIAQGMKDTIWYELAIYFYLHFQYNGWFLLAIISLVLYQMKGVDSDNWQRAFNLFFLSTILNYSLSTLWTNPGWVINIISVLSSIMQIHALFLVRTDLHNYLKTQERFKYGLYTVIYTLFVIKVFFSLLGSIQEVADFVYQNRNLTIGYLHAIFLGVVTPFIIHRLVEAKKVTESRNYKRAMLLFFLFFLISELFLTVSALGINGESLMILLHMLITDTWLLSLSSIALAVIVMRGHESN